MALGVSSTLARRRRAKLMARGGLKVGAMGKPEPICQLQVSYACNMSPADSIGGNSAPSPSALPSCPSTATCIMRSLTSLPEGKEQSEVTTGTSSIGERIAATHAAAGSTKPEMPTRAVLMGFGVPIGETSDRDDEVLPFTVNPLARILHGRTGASSGLVSIASTVSNAAANAGEGVAFKTRRRPSAKPPTAASCTNPSSTDISPPPPPPPPPLADETDKGIHCSTKYFFRAGGASGDAVGKSRMSSGR
jgi:hypothetical protein